jgi:hypothetical protein
MAKILQLAIFTFLIAGCTSHPESKNDKPVARAYENYLYTSDLSGVIPAGTSAADSATLAKDYIEKWIRNQLLLNKAEINLTEAEKDVELQIESYRSSLLIYAYQQSYLRQNLDTVVSDKELEDYYNQNKSNFILSESLFKGLFIKVPVTAPETYKLRQWYRSDDPESIKNVEAYCFQHAAVYDDFEENWVKIDEVLRMLPDNGGSYEPALLSRKYLETRDKDYLYLLSAKEIAPEGTVSPFDLVNDDIHYIILNKRKILLINQLELNIYADAQNHEYFTIYQK